MTTRANDIQNIHIDNLSFVYEGSSKPVINRLSTSFSAGWTGVVGPNGCGKSTLLEILDGRLKPTSGTITGIQGTSAYCRQETNTKPSDLMEFLESYDKDAIRLKGSLELFGLEAVNWPDLSHGERKRMQLGVALCQQPDLLLLDEPTNHLDSLNRNFIIQTLQQYRGIGVLVSHDRELLDTLCKQCVIYNGDRVFTVAGNYSEAAHSVEQEVRSKQKQVQSLKETANSLKRESNRISEINKGSHKRLSKRGLSPKDHDAKNKIEAARLTNKDSTLSQKKINIERRIGKAEEEIKSLRTAKSYADTIFFESGKAHKKVLLREKPQTIELPGVLMKTPELVIESGAKIGITGFNGVGKSSLIQWLLGGKRLKNCNFFYLQQELDSADKAKLKQELDACSKEDYSKCLQIIARLGSDAKQIIGSDSLSSGETRKVAIALAIVRQVDLLILDEPSNHLDLHSVKHLEQALAQCNFAVLMISHDRHFVDAVCSVRWHIDREGQESVLRVIL